MFKILIPAVASLGLLAFAAKTQPVAAVDAPPAAEAMAWHLSQEGEMAKLAYGVANSDQLALMVTCMPGDRTAVVYGDVQVEGARLTQARIEIDPLSGGAAEDTTLPVNDPALAGLARDGRMTVVGDAGRFQLAASTGERRLVRDFLSYCSPGRA